ncbi:MAG: DUF2125 domain-containing protein [Hyphomicrobiales bacterium]
MTEAPTATRSATNKFRWLAIAIAVVVAIICGGWFVGAHFYKLALSEGQNALAREGVTLTCNDESLGGFPARFEWRCSALTLTAGNGAMIAGGSFHTVAPIWNPLFTVAEWQGPYQTLSADGLDAEINSPLLRASVRANTSLELERLSAVLDPFAVTLQGAPQPIGSAQGAELHVRQSEDGTPGNLEMATILLGVESLFLGGVDAVDLSITGTAEELGLVRARTLSGIINEWINRSGRLVPMAVRIRLDDHAIDLTGNAMIATDRLIDFDGSIATNDVAALVELMGVDDQNGANAIVAGAMLFGRQTTIGEDPATELPVIVERGAVRMGPVTLGQLPPLGF